MRPIGLIPIFHCSLYILHYMVPPALSVIIPTHKRPAILRQCLEHLERQTIADRIEVIVVSDGHDEATAKQFIDPKSYQLSAVRFFTVEKSQQGVARNRGVEAATGEIVLFIGDDVFLAPDACERHVKTHKKLSAVLGFTTWDTALEITPVMRWLERTGWQFGYPMLKPYAHDFVPAELQHRFSYTSHISLPTAIARAHPFREDVTLYGWEDILWGQELRDAGVRLFYEPDARAAHHHPVTLHDSLARMETLGKSLLHFEKIAPGLDRKPRGLKLLAYRVVALLPTMRGRHYRAFLNGLAAGS